MTVNEQEQRLHALLQPLPTTAGVILPTSRYSGIRTAVLDPDGERPILYLQRRFVPQPERLVDAAAHVVVAGERTDHVAAIELGNAELFWRVCDANRAIFAEDLMTEPGRRLRITRPEVGLP